MNEQMASPTPASILNAGQEWLTLPFALIALGVVAALLILWWGARLASRRRQGREDLAERGETHHAGTAAPVLRTQPPVSPSPPPIADAELPASSPAAEPVQEPAPLADEPIVAASALDASPASVAASGPASVSVSVSTPGGDADDFTRMKGVGPKLAERLHALGIKRFAQIAELSPGEAAALDAQLGNFQGRLQRDRWIDQARLLAAGDTAAYEAQFGKL